MAHKSTCIQCQFKGAASQCQWRSFLAAHALLMSPPSSLHIKRCHTAGFTLIESLVCMAIIGALMGLALPRLELHWQKIRRQDAQNSLMQLHLRQMQWRGLHAQYASTLSELNWVGTHSISKHYHLSLQSSNTHGYILHATPVGLQSRDATCSSMSLRISENSRVLATSNESLLNDTEACWKW
jgi:type IV pilus assembly protein PilE